MVLSGIILIYGINITKNSHAEVIAASKILLKQCAFPANAITYAKNNKVYYNKS